MLSWNQAGFNGVVDELGLWKQYGALLRREQAQASKWQSSRWIYIRSLHLLEDMASVVGHRRCAWVFKAFFVVSWKCKSVLLHASALGLETFASDVKSAGC